MRVLFLIVFLLVHYASFSECEKLISNKLKSLGDIPYRKFNKEFFEVKSGDVFNIKLTDVFFKAKHKFLFQSENLGDTLDISLVGINRRILFRKKITNDDCIIDYEPFIKSGNYFFVIQTKKVLDEDSKPIMGCLGLVTFERITYKNFRKLQRIKWKKNNK